MLRRVAHLSVMTLAAAAFAQQQPETVIRINVNLVQVDVVVTDSKGASVAGLIPEDFEIRQDGKLQTITNFSYNRITPETSTSASRAPGAPPTALQPTQVRRTIVAVVDDLQMSFDHLVAVRDGLKKFIDRQLQPGDLMAILRTSGGMGAFQQLTSDPRALRAAADAIHYNAPELPAMSFAPVSADPDSQAIERRAQLGAIGALGAIRYVVNGLHEMPGRKLLVLFTDNLPLFVPPNGADYDDPHAPPPEPGHAVPDMANAMQRLIDAASRSSVTIDTVDPRGFGLMNQNFEATEYARDGLRHLAKETGGRFFTNNNDISDVLKKAVDDAGSYYLIGYHPDAATFEGEGAPSQFRKISVRVKRPELTVRTRSGFFGASESAAAPSDTVLSPQTQLLRALNSPFAADGIHVRLTPVFTDSPQTGPLFQAMLYIDTRDLTFNQEADGSHTAAFDLIAASYDANGQIVERTNRTYTLKAPAETFAAGREEGLLYQFSHPAAKPGTYQFRIALRDARSGKMGSANQLIETPDLKSGRLGLSSLIVRAASSQDLTGSAAVRAFGAGAQIDYGYQILNAHLSPSGAPEIESQVSLWRDGKQIFAGAPKRLDATPAAGPHEIDVGGALQLPPALLPGDYLLQVTVTDHLAKEKFRTATQWIDFQIHK